MLSIVIPSSGRPDCLAQTLPAILRQQSTWPEHEIMIVDDSRDGSVAQRLRAGHLCQIVRGPRKSPAAARNVGARASCGETLVFLDDDCVPAEGCMSAYLSAATRFPDAMLAGPIVNGLPGNPWAEAYHVILGYLYERHAQSSKSRQPFLSAANFAVPREAFLELGGFDECFTTASEDRAFSAKWLRSARRFRAVPQACVTHFHPLTLPRYLSQQFRYGRGGQQFRRWAKQASPDCGHFEPVNFYGGLVHYAIQQRPRTSVLMAVLLSQAAVASGAACEILFAS